MPTSGTFVREEAAFPLGENLLAAVFLPADRVMPEKELKGESSFAFETHVVTTGCDERNRRVARLPTLQLKPVAIGPFLTEGKIGPRVITLFESVIDRRKIKNPKIDA